MCVEPLRPLMKPCCAWEMKWSSAGVISLVTVAAMMRFSALLTVIGRVRSTAGEEFLGMM